MTISQPRLEKEEGIREISNRLVDMLDNENKRITYARMVLLKLKKLAFEAER